MLTSKDAATGSTVLMAATSSGPAFEVALEATKYALEDKSKVRQRPVCTDCCVFG